ncbi:MAG: hypothetical protein J5506_02970 [Prevotella sp.]|nr:hypothetical protein [Prevotella sp.]
MMKRVLIAGVLLATSLLGANAAVDENFHIYLCFGQSNMEGNAQWESVDNEVDSRFQMLATCNFSNPNRSLGNWYTANCPIVSPAGKLGPTDYFGRTMVACMPTNVKIGVVAVAMGGSPIEMFDKDKYQQKMKDNPGEWWVSLANQYYGGNPYGRLVEMAKKAQQVGVIKGILLHQGCSNCGDPNWPNMVKKIYNDMLTDLGLQAADVPLFVGETEREEMGGGCSYHNTVVAKVPSVIPTAHVVSSENIPGNGRDGWHFSALGYRMFGRRYAVEALKVMGAEPKVNANYTMPNNLKNFLTVKSLNVPSSVSIRVGSTKSVNVEAVFQDNHKENVSSEAKFTLPSFLKLENGKLTATAEGSGDVTVSFTDMTGNTVTAAFHVEGTLQGNNHVMAVNNNQAGSNPWDKQLGTMLNKQMTVGKTYVVKAWVKADNGGDCALWALWTDSPNRDQWGNSSDVQYLDTKKVTSTYQEFTWEFTAQYVNNKLSFAFGKIGGMVYFDDVSCKEKGTDNEMVVNGNFESDDISKWEVISWGNQQMKIEEDAVSGISTVSTAASPASQAIYTLDGCRVNSGFESLRPGVYVVGGKKVVVGRK